MNCSYALIFGVTNEKIDVLNEVTMNSIRMIVEKIKDGSIHEMWEEFKWMFSYGKKYRKEIIFYIFLGIFSTCMTLISSIASKELIDIVMGIQKNRVVEMAILMVSMALFSLLFTQLMSRITLKMNIRIQNEIQADIFDKIIKVNWMDLTSYHSGDLLNRFMNDVKTVANSAIGWLPNLMINSFNFVATLGLILYYDPTIFLLTIINTPVMLLSSRLFMKKMRDHNKMMKEMNSEMIDFEIETFNSIDSIKSFHLDDLFNRRLLNYQEKYKKVNLDYNKYTIQSQLVLSIIGMIINFSFYGWTVMRLWSGAITYGEMTLFLQQSSRMTGIFRSLVGIIPSTITSTISAGRLMEIISLPKEETDVTILNELRMMSDYGFEVDIDHVSFFYIDGKDVLISSTMKAKPHEIIALVGPSGQGKTTMIRLILGLIQAQSGQAFIVDCNGKKYPLSVSTRDLFSYVPQGNTVFTGTIAENLRMVKENATDEEIIEALEAACAYRFVKKMKDGIHSKIGGHGKGLSEGQAQRIAIARAILKDSPILLLDEATSALDVQTEKEVLLNIMKLNSNKTCIVTTHRPSVLSLCQRIYQINDAQMNEMKPDEYSKLIES